MNTPATYVIFRAGIVCLAAATLTLVAFGLAGNGPLHGWHAPVAWILSGF